MIYSCLVEYIEYIKGYGTACLKNPRSAVGTRRVSDLVRAATPGIKRMIELISTAIGLSLTESSQEISLPFTWRIPLTSYSHGLACCPSEQRLPL
jgi:hypothetical protein